MGDRDPVNQPKQDDSDPSNATGGPVFIPAIAAFVGALVGAAIGSQLS